VYVLALAVAAAYVGHAFVGILVLGVFGYYATRPICVRVSEVVDSDRLAATATVLVILVPVLALLAYASYEVVQQVQQVTGTSQLTSMTARLVDTGAGSAAGGNAAPAANATSAANGTAAGGSGSAGGAAGSLPADPIATIQQLPASPMAALQKLAALLQATFGLLVLLGLSLTLSNALLERDDALAETFVTLVGGRDTTAYAYALAVDDDLESIFFGNLLFALTMAVVATAVYAGTNLVAPEGLHVPLVLVAGVLTGFASLIPIVVGKVVYLPVVGILTVQSFRTPGNQLPFVGAAFVVYLVVLDLLPQSVIQPYFSGRQFDTLLLLFAYILGPMLFGWYGFFLLPILTVLAFEAVRIVLPQLLQGESLGAEPSVAADVGANPEELRDESESTPSSEDASESSSSGGEGSGSSQSPG
jgi:predicted PurR-regulated permease PerM